MVALARSKEWSKAGVVSPLSENRFIKFEEPNSIVNRVEKVMKFSISKHFLPCLMPCSQQSKTATSHEIKKALVSSPAKLSDELKAPVKLGTSINLLHKKYIPTASDKP